jgi:hypothetical protein
MMKDIASKSTTRFVCVNKRRVPNLDIQMLICHVAKRGADEAATCARHTLGGM